MLPTPALIGRQFANFRILRLLGRGGMAEVYYGWDVKLQRPVAIKVIDARFRDNPVYAQRFVNEARSMAAWNHPNILPIYYADDEGGYYYYVMEYIHGLDLEQVLNEYSRRQELAPLEDVLRIGGAAAAALDFAHQNGVVHRDVKPSNLLISATGRIVLSDFGLAMHVAQGSIGQVFGSPYYIAPEQARNSAEAVAQSDVYALGIILYEMLTGTTPYDDPSPTALALQHLMLEPPPPRQINPALHPAVEGVLLKALRKAPGERYPSAGAFMAAMEQALSIPADTAPFIPAGAAEETAQRPVRRPSHLPVAEIVARHLEERQAAQGEEARQHGEGARPAAGPAARLRPVSWWGIGCAALLVAVLLVFAGAALAFNRPWESARRPGATTAAWTAAAPAETTALPDSSGAATGTPFVSNNPPPDQPPTEIPSEIPTETPPEPSQPVPSPTETGPAEATEIPAEEPPSEPPPPAPQSGDLFVMFYDDSSFYLLNRSGKDRSVFPFAFERLDQKGNPANRFEGWQWGNLYPKSRTGYCLVLEILEFTQHLSPPECDRRYLVIRTPTQKQGTIFWTKSKGSKEFRVLWDDVEVGRCEIAANTCEVYLP